MNLHSLCEELWNEILADSPEFGAYRCVDKFPDTLDSYLPEKYEKRQLYCHRILKQAELINRTELNAGDKITLDILIYYLTSCIH